jgi:integrase/recombinase XerD
MAGQMTSTGNNCGAGPDVQSLVAAFEKDCHLRNWTPESIRRYISGLRILNGFCQRERYDMINIQDKQLIHFLTYLRDERHNCQKTVVNVFTMLTSFYEYLEFNKMIPRNPLPPICKRYIRTYKSDSNRGEKRLLSIEEMSHLISTTFNIRDLAIMMLFAKTGIRRNELITLDLDDINLPEGKVTLKPTAKRSNRIVFFDNECAIKMKEWLAVRERMHPDTRALFVNSLGHRVNKTDIYDSVTLWAKRAGYHDPGSSRVDQHFGPHCFRHWFTTWLIRNRMPRDYVKELRGDAKREAIDIYNHIDLEELKKAYLATIPKLFSTSTEDVRL